MHDIVIIGGGAAGMTAALYALRAGKTVMVLEKSNFGGQIAYSPKVENFPGTASMSGSEFADRLFTQITDLGADFDIVTVSGIEDKGSHKTVRTEDGVDFDGKSVIIATGAKHRQLGIAGEEELSGNGICYCAVCDGDFFRGKDVAMVGGGNTALQEAIFLSDICREVTIVQNLDYFTGEDRLINAVQKRGNIKCLLGSKVSAFEEKDGELCGVQVCISDQEETLHIPLDGLFIAVGLEPQNDCFADLVQLDSWGYIQSDENCLTKTPGIFAAGDTRTKRIRQLTTAVSDGTVAAITACSFLE